MWFIFGLYGAVSLQEKLGKIEEVEYGFLFVVFPAISNYNIKEISAVSRKMFGRIRNRLKG